MLIAEIRSPRGDFYGVNKSDYTEEQWRLLYDTWPNFNRHGSSFDSFYKKEDDYYFGTACGKTRLNYDEAELFEANGIHLKIEGIDGTMLTKLRGRFGADHIRASDIRENRVVQITLPDIGLLYIDEVTWLDDACTEELQGYLDDGWRILAVCPPNAQRRPDYILGRRKSKVI